MDLKIKKFFLFIILVLLQSCSGGRIGNFIESSFKNIEEPKRKEDTKNNLNNKVAVKSDVNDVKNKNIAEQKIEEDTKNNLNNKVAVKSDVNGVKNKNIAEQKIEEDTKNNLKKQIFIKPDEKIKNKKKITNQNISSQKKRYQPQSYKIIFILRDVDPKDPIEDLSTILRNSDVNFEIEKIERFFESNNKNLNNN